MPRKKTHLNRAREDMQKLGVYKPEFDHIIEVYSQICDQYDELTKRFIASGYSFSEETQTGSKKAPIVTTLESLRKDILSYAAQLGLTPQGILKADDAAFAKKKVNMLAAALKAAGE